MQDRLRELIHDMNYSVTEIRKIMAEEAGVTIDDVPSTSTIRQKLRDWNIRIKDQLEDVQVSALRPRDQPQASLYEDPALIVSFCRQGKLLWSLFSVLMVPLHRALQLNLATPSGFPSSVPPSTLILLCSFPMMS